MRGHSSSVGLSGARADFSFRRLLLKATTHLQLMTDKGCADTTISMGPTLPLVLSAGFHGGHVNAVWASLPRKGGGGGGHRSSARSVHSKRLRSWNLYLYLDFVFHRLYRESPAWSPPPTASLPSQHLSSVLFCRGFCCHSRPARPIFLSIPSFRQRLSLNIENQAVFVVSWSIILFQNRDSYLPPVTWRRLPLCPVVAGTCVG